MNGAAGPKLLPLAQSEGVEVGGKAAGLARLIRMGLRVPDGFVVVGAAPGRLPDGLEEACGRLGGAVAVRSSAVGEDGADASFAGQYETLLGVQGPAAIREAIERCLASAHSARAKAYQDSLDTGGEAPMAVVVQRMVDATAAGVLFTADPVTGQRDRVVVNAVPGLGEALVGGHRAADQFVLSREGAVIERTLQTDRAAIDEGTLRRLLRDAMEAEAKLGHPVDMEWAIAPDGTVYWLQSRPITTLDMPDLNELDSVLDDPRALLTNYNVSEILPGALTPLTWCAFGLVLDGSIRDLYERMGVRKAMLDKHPRVVSFYGHLYLNLSAMYAIGSEILGSDKKALDYSIAGQLLPDVELGPLAPLPRRMANMGRYFGLLFQARARFEELYQRMGSYQLEPAPDAEGIYQQLEAGILQAREGFAVHAHCSSPSGATLTMILNMLSQGKPPQAEHYAAASALLVGASPGADLTASSLALAPAIEHLGRVISESGSGAPFAAMGVNEALAWLRGGAPEPVRRAFEAFLQEHGHRCIREGELRERDWGEDPRPLVQNLQHSVAAPRAAAGASSDEGAQVLARLPWVQRKMIAWLLPKARSAVVLRERSKSLAVRICRSLKRGYLALAEKLVAAGRMPDTDLVFFFTHEELGELVRAPNHRLVKRALHRRRLHPQKMALELPRVCHGKPVPLSEQAHAGDAGEALKGTPVSRGVVVGPARVARTQEEASAIQPGEILVVQYTDVGWAPYFCRAAGLATEIGSPLSHGAVVAREYGLPAVVNLTGATRRFKTGEVVRLDGNTGEIRRVG